MKTFNLPVNNCVLALDLYPNDNADVSIVFLHGGPGGRASYVSEFPLAKALGKTYNTVFFDQRGGGRSIYDLSHEISKEDVINDVLAVIEFTKEVFGKPVYLAGLSYGGSLALMYLEHYSQTIQGAVIASPALMTIEYEGNLQVWNKSLEIALPMLPAPLQQEIHKTNGTKEGLMQLMNSDALHDFICANPEPMSDWEILWYCYAMKDWYLEHFDLRPILSKLSIPILLLQGREDEICPEFLLTEAVEQADNSNIRYHILSPCSHDIFRDGEETIKSLIKDFCI